VGIWRRGEELQGCHFVPLVYTKKKKGGRGRGEGGHTIFHVPITG
jgi:hypothetical protein